MASTCTVAELQNNFDSLASAILDTGEPLFIDQGGQSDIVMVPADSYLHDMQALSEFKRIFMQDGATPAK